MRNFRLRNVRFRPLFAIGVLLGALLLIHQSQSTLFSQKITQNPSGSASGLGFTTVRKDTCSIYNPFIRHSSQGKLRFHDPANIAHGHGHALFGEQVVIHAASRKEKIPEWKDWHDYNLIEEESKRTGPGEQGQAVELTEHEREDAAYKENGFNIFVSDRVSLDRSLRDIRHQNCKTRKYFGILPTTSIIIPFHNEGMSTLLRTVHSIINRSPDELLKEIILVDDYSAREWLGSKLESSLSRLSPKIRLMRNEKREGLIRTRLNGIKAATGDTIVILDSHVEVYHNWLPPLLQPIAENKKTIVCPMIDIIDKDDFHYIAQPGDAMRGGFDWELWYKRIPIPRELKPKDLSDPFDSPVMAGGLFAIDREYFAELGYYDSGLEIWGGEQYELSFKVWMCGGRMVDAPCSRVGHIYRKFVPYSVPVSGGVNYNFKRVAEVWMDEYKEFFYRRRPYVRNLDCGDLTEAKALRQKLNCKSFKWYMTEVIPDLVKYYPPEILPSAAWGRLIHKESNKCVDFSKRPVSVSNCPILPDDHRMDMQLTWNEDIRQGQTAESAQKKCMDASYRSTEVLIWNCHNQHGNQLWKYRSGQMYHPTSKKCASVSINDTHQSKSSTNQYAIKMIPCDGDDHTQQWNWQFINSTILTRFNANPERSVNGD